MYDILGDVSKIWGTLDKNQQLYYLNTQAGANQTQNLAAALNNYNHVQEATETALNSSGSAIRQNGVYMDSLEARTKSVKAEFEDFANKTINNGLLKALLGLAKNGLEIVNTKFGRFITVATLATGALAGLFTLIKSFNIASLLTSPVGIAAAAIGTIVALISTTASEEEEFVKDTRKLLSELREEVNTLNDSLESNKARLLEISKIPLDERTDAIKRESAALQTENVELERQLELKTRERAAALRSGYSDYTLGIRTGVQKYGFTTDEALRGAQDEGGIYYEDWGNQTMLYDTLEEATAAYERATQAQKDYEDGTISYAATVTSGIEYVDAFATETKDVSNAMKLLSGAMKDQWGEYKTTYGYLVSNNTLIAENASNIYELVKNLNEMRDAGFSLTAEEEEFLQLAEKYGITLDGITNTLVVNRDTTKALSGVIAELNGAIVDNNGYYSINIDKLFSEENQANHTKEELADLAAKVILLNNTQMTSQQKVLSLLRIAQAAGMAGDALTLFNEAAKGDTRAGQALIAKYGSIDAAWASLTATNVGEVANTPALTGSGGGGGSSGSGGRSSSSSANNAIQKQLDAIGDKIDQINEKYDIQIKALESANDELKRQLELEQKLADLEEARSKRVLVYKDGRFQYANDIDAIANAQNALNAYNRELELQAAKDAIEAARKAELAPWEAQKEKLEKQKRGYASGTLSAAGGLSLVGERGAELRVLNKGDGIIPANMTKNLMQWGKFSPKQLNTGNTVFNISGLSLPNVRNAEDFIAGLKNLAMQRAYKRA